jgi:hypothetical protein
LKSLAVAGDAGSVLTLVVDPSLERGGVVGVEARRRMYGDPAANDVFVGPAIGDAWVESAENVEVVVEDGESADGNGELPGEGFESGLDPGLAVFKTLAAEKGPSHAA